MKRKALALLTATLTSCAFNTEPTVENAARTVADVVTLPFRIVTTLIGKDRNNDNSNTD